MAQVKELSPVGKPKGICPLVGEDGNAFAIMGRASKALRKSGHTKEEVDQYFAEAKSGDYDNLLMVTTNWVDEPEPEFLLPEL